MSITLERIFSDPSLYLHSFDGEDARFVDLSREEFAQSIFFDRRIKREGEMIYRVPVDVLLGSMDDAGPAASPVNFIHHVAQCGSTLLSRAIDRPQGALAIREPNALRQLGVEATSSPHLRGDWAERLRLTLRLLSKRFEDGPVVIKGNVPTTMIALPIEQFVPRQTGILLHFPLDDYLAAVLRTPQHAEWVRSITDELNIGRYEIVGDLDALSIPQRAAALWALMIGQFARLLAINPALRSLDANRLFDEPHATVSAASDLFGLGMSNEDVAQQVEGGLFKTYAKNPDVDYDPAQRVTRREETKRDYPDAIREARDWVMARKDDIQLPESLARPLVGDGAPLL